MNRSAYPPRAASAHRAGTCLMLTLWSVAATSATSLAPESSETLESRPYLAAIGSPSMRFAEAIPPPDLTVRPVPSGPPNPVEESAAHPMEPAKSEVASTAPQTAAESAAPTSSSISEPVRAAPAKVVPPILPDDTRPKVKAEDFLPFFQFPAPGANNGDITVVAPVPTAPAPAPLPPSSATYRQQ